jgi:hypothetical protein
VFEVIVSLMAVFAMCGWDSSISVSGRAAEEIQVVGHLAFDRRWKLSPRRGWSVTCCRVIASSYLDLHTISMLSREVKVW